MNTTPEHNPSIHFRGMHAKQIDAKARVGTPKPFRDLLGEAVEQVMLVRGLGRDRFLEIWPTAAWERMADQVRLLDGADKRKTLMRGYISQAIECKLDNQGRLVIPPYYREYAGLDGDVLWIGGGSMMELWSKTRFEEKDDALRNEAYQVFLDNEDKFTS
jgi:MraZ protein